MEKLTDDMRASLNHCAKAGHNITVFYVDNGDNATCCSKCGLNLQEIRQSEGVEPAGVPVRQ